MENLSKNNHQYLKARDKVKKLKDFYIHIAVTLIAMPVVVFVNLMFSPEFHWFWIAIWGMIFSLIIHWMSNLKYGKDWEDKKINQLLKKYKK